jgi:sugar phosphate isomerase/epimerase
MAHRFRHAMCNEAFEGRPFAQACASIRKAGYEGIEIAPFTLAEDPAALSPALRREYRSVIEGTGLRFAGLHWLLVSPAGLHVTTGDPAVRERAWRYIHHLVDLCGDLGPDGVLVFGSPKQRGTTVGVSRAQATRHFADGLAGVAPHAAERGVTVLIEALPADQCDVVQTLGEAVELVREIDHPAIRTMFDVHNAAGETEPHASLVEKHFALIRHVHVNEPDGRHCGRGSYDFRPVLEVLGRHHYAGWISLEAFDFSYGAETIAGESLRYLEDRIQELTS